MQSPWSRFYVWGISAGEKRPKPGQIVHVKLVFSSFVFNILAKIGPLKKILIFTWRPFPTTVCPSNIQTWGSVGHEHFPRSRMPVEHLLLKKETNFIQKIETWSARSPVQLPRWLPTRSKSRAVAPLGRTHNQYLVILPGGWAVGHMVLTKSRAIAPLGSQYLLGSTLMLPILDSVNSKFAVNNQSQMAMFARVQ